jgi:Na+-transporting methylmalonyl-CoA/oxaloacetate decarboxylase beta subunit
MMGILIVIACLVIIFGRSAMASFGKFLLIVTVFLVGSAAAIGLYASLVAR